MNVVHFSLFNGGLPHDLMHDALEVIDCHYFSIAEYNRHLLVFNY